MKKKKPIVNKDSDKLLRFLGLSTADIRSLKRVSDIKAKFLRPMRVSDIEFFKSGTALGMVYRKEEQKIWDAEVAVKKVYSDKSTCHPPATWEWYTKDGWPFDIHEVLENHRDEPDFELVDIQNEDDKWSLYILRPKEKIKKTAKKK